MTGLVLGAWVLVGAFFHDPLVAQPVYFATQAACEDAAAWRNSKHGRSFPSWRCFPTGTN